MTHLWIIRTWSKKRWKGGLEHSILHCLSSSLVAYYTRLPKPKVRCQATLKIAFTKNFICNRHPRELKSGREWLANGIFSWIYFIIFFLQLSEHICRHICFKYWRELVEIHFSIYLAWWSHGVMAFSIFLRDTVHRSPNIQGPQLSWPVKVWDKIPL